MKGFWNTICPVFIVIEEWFRWFLGGCDSLLYALFIFIIVNYITGMICAIVNRKLSSEMGFREITKKGMIFLLVGISNILDVQVIIGSGALLRTATIIFYISYEGMSILRNVVCLGLPIPKKLEEILEQLYEK